MAGGGSEKKRVSGVEVGTLKGERLLSVRVASYVRNLRGLGHA